MRALPHWVPIVFWDKVGEWQQFWGGRLARVSDSLVGSCVWLSQGIPFSHADSRGGWFGWRRSLPSTPPREPSRPRSTWTRCRRPEVHALAPSRGKDCREIPAPRVRRDRASLSLFAVQVPLMGCVAPGHWVGRPSTAPSLVGRQEFLITQTAAHHLTLLEELLLMLECNRPCIKTPLSAADGA